VFEGHRLDERDAEVLFDAEGADVFDLFAASNRVRERFRGNRVSLCSIINAKSGRCPEDCKFCSQSALHSSNIPEYPLKGAEEIASAAREAAKSGAASFGIVTSGRALNEKEFKTVLKAVEKIASEGVIEPDASIGVIDRARAEALKKAGLKKYHHNLEAARSFYAEVCTTRTYDENAAAVRAAQDAGLEVCCGALFGMGETRSQRVELLLELRSLGVKNVPVNYLNPIPGTAFEKREKMSPMEALKTIAIARMLMPDAEIRVCGGRLETLDELQPLMFAAGASGLMIGNYLTTRGREVKDDLSLIETLGLEYERA
jgi:biotin synthase